ncbi:MAG TPA: glycine/sarcosine/betaine reductase selenoprotein B family protein [Candidatus Acidoferrum sp.]|nr:glycine/sarcosine/betaine reductase selenoprotein B family protein [Candidatus Acidoferrum sp.]
MVVDSFKFLPRSFRPLYEGRGPFPGEEHAVWAPFEKRLAESRIALLTSAGMYVKGAQPSFDLEREQTHPEWGDPSWRAIADSATAGLAVAHLHINDADLVADPEIALPRQLLGKLASEGRIGGAVNEHVSVMGYQERALHDWQTRTAPELVAHLREQGADGLILAPV